MNDPSEFQEAPAKRDARLKQALSSAANHAADVNKLALQSSVDIGKEKTQYFEKISLGCGATAALIVSFVGAHAGSLRPKWMLRSALVTLVLTMMFGFLRNWLFPWYLMGVWGRRDMKAKLDTALAQRDLIQTGSVILIEDGKLIETDSWLQGFQKDHDDFKKKMGELQRMEERSFVWTRRVEFTTLGLASVGMVLLVALAWLNF